MSKRTPKKYTYQQAGATLIIGYDEVGRLFSRIEKNGKVVASKIYIKMPPADILEKQGWVRTYE